LQKSNQKKERTMRVLWVASIAALLAVAGCSSAEKSVSKADAAIETKVRRMVAKMTLEEKVGQMTQLTL